MAKSTNGIGQFRGKMGGVVFSVRNGQQIIRNYQPVVTNPKSNQQRLQRAKAVLAGKLSHIIDAGLLIGMNGGNKSARRSEFNRILLDAIQSEIAITTGTVKAVLVPEKLVLSQGDDFHPLEPTTNPIIIDSNDFFVKWDSENANSLTRVVLIASFWNSLMQEYEWRVFEKIVPVSDNDTTFNIPVNWRESGSYGDVFAYAVPFVVDEEKLRENGTPLASSDDIDKTQFIANLVATQSSAIAYAKSIFLGKAEVNYIPAN